MAFFDSILTFIANIASPVLGFVTNERATSQAIAGQQQGFEQQLALTQLAIDELRAGKVEALERIDVRTAQAFGLLDEGTANAIATYQELVRTGQSGTDYLRRIVALPPDQLTQAQLIGKRDLARDINTQLATSGLRGAGRSGQAVLADAMSRYTASAQATNLARSDQAAGDLAKINIGGIEKTAAAEAALGRGGANIATAAGTSEANAALGTGTNVAVLQSDLGSSAADIAGNIGTIRATNTQEQGTLIGNAIGNISGLISDSEKRKQTARRFEADTGALGSA